MALKGSQTNVGLHLTLVFKVLKELIINKYLPIAGQGVHSYSLVRSSKVLA